MGDLWIWLDYFLVVAPPLIAFVFYRWGYSRGEQNQLDRLFSQGFIERKGTRLKLTSPEQRSHRRWTDDEVVEADAAFVKQFNDNRAKLEEGTRLLAANDELLRSEDLKSERIGGI